MTVKNFFAILVLLALGTIVGCSGAAPKPQAKDGITAQATPRFFWGRIYATGNTKSRSLRALKPEAKRICGSYKLKDKASVVSRLNAAGDPAEWTSGADLYCPVRR
jgi:hypothetical protein